MSENSYSEWLEFAKMDLDAAEYLRDMYPTPVEIICYHCEQAVEKFLKAVLVHDEKRPPKTHDLVTLCKLCSEENAEFNQLSSICLRLTPYGVQVRYPSDINLGEDDVSKALEGCRYVQDFV